LVILALVALLSEGLRWRHYGRALVLSELNLSPDAENQDLIYIRGHAAGLFAWFFSLIGLRQQATFRLSQQELLVNQNSLFGYDLDSVPIRNLSSSRCGYYRAITFLVLAFGLYAWGGLRILVAVTRTQNDYAQQTEFRGLAVSLVGIVALGAVSYLVYALSKRFYLRVETNGGEHLGLTFKRSLIGNVVVELPQAITATEILNRKILEAANAR